MNIPDLSGDDWLANLMTWLNVHTDAEILEANRAIQAGDTGAYIMDVFRKQYTEALKAAAVPEKTWRKQLELFERWKRYAEDIGHAVMPPAPAQVCDFLIGLKVAGKTLAQCKRHADAIQAVSHSIGYHVADAFIDCALNVIRDIEKGPGGGSTLTGGLSAAPAPVPMAASS
jgi:hypothetical protein